MDETLGGLLRRAREAKGPTWTLDYVARQIGRPSTWLSNLETGRTKGLPEAAELRKIGDILGLTMPELLQGAGFLDHADFAQERVNPFEHDDPRWQLVEKLKRLDPEHPGSAFVAKAVGELIDLAVNDGDLFIGLPSPEKHIDDRTHTRNDRTE